MIGDVTITATAHDGPDVTADDLLDTDEIAAMIGISSSAFRTGRSRRQFVGLPEPLRNVSGRPVWSRRAIAAWLGGGRTT